MSRPHSDSPIEVRAGSDGAVGDVIFQISGKLSLNGFARQLNGVFNPDRRTGEFGLYAVENPTDVYTTILAQTAVAANVATETV